MAVVPMENTRLYLRKEAEVEEEEKRDGEHSIVVYGHSSACICIYTPQLSN